jgi:hypothetical protein
VRALRAPKEVIMKTSSKIRFTRGRTCPICGGSDSDPRGQGTRCFGFISGDWVHCTRQEHAGKATFHRASGTYSHKASGPCPCGQEHAPAAPGSTPAGKSRKTIDHVYRYRDANGKVVHETVRYRDPKDFRQRRPIGNGKFAWNLDGIEPVLYNLPALIAADPGEPVWIPEGEKDADRLGTEDALATTNPMGAGKWRDHYSPTLRGRHCFIIPDNDQAGREHAQQVAGSLYGVAADVRIVELPGLPEGGDVSDFLAAGGTMDQLSEIANRAPVWSPSNVSGPAPSANGNGRHQGQNGRIDYATLTDDELGLTLASDVKPTRVHWLWEYLLARGEMALIAGEGGLGKSMFLLACAAAVSNGSRWPDGSGDAPRGHVVIVSAEDKADTTLRPRLEALGANLKNITFCRARIIMERDGERLVHPMSLQDHAYWRAVLDRHPDTVLFIVDPIPSYLGRGVNDRQNSEIRGVLEPFVEDVIRPRDICFYANTHLNKSIDARTPVQRITGSIAYANIPRNVHIIVRDPEQPDRRFFKQCKCNNGPDNLDAIAFKIEQTFINDQDGTDIETAIPEFEEGLHKIDLASVMNGERGRRGPRPVKSSRIAEWLWEQLKAGQAVQVMDLVDRARDAELLDAPTDKEPKPSISRLYRARERIPQLHQGRGWDVEEGQVTVGSKVRTTWRLVKCQTEAAGDEKPDEDGAAF